MGGTFDPIHFGHLRAAETAREALQLDQVLFVPAAQPPHREAPLASPQDRFAMVGLAAAENARFVASDVELLREGPSYTVDTLGTLRSACPSDQLVLIVGSDTFPEMRSWRDAQRVFELSEVAVVARAQRRRTGAGGVRERHPTAVAAAPQRALPAAGTGRGLHRAARALPMKRVALLQRAARAALEKKAADVVALDLRRLNSFTDYFLLASAQNQKQLVAIADAVLETLRGEGLRPDHVEGYPRQEWILLDYDDFVVHLFTPRSRAFYGLERLWGEASRIEVAV
jgi:nicotinate (nicotinamide) nucleotide adenylyltransferase/ribosome silencing factor RsfS/YbeB/iojap